MNEQPKTWRAVNRVGKRGLAKGMWLVDPNGKQVATIQDGALARQLAAAMNLTTTKQRTDYSADAAGYKSEKP